MWFTSWSGKTSVWTILHTHAAALLHTYTVKKNSARIHTDAHPKWQRCHTHAAPPAAIPALWRKTLWPLLVRRIQDFCFGSLHVQTQIHITRSRHTYIHTCACTGLLTHRRINRKQPKQTVDYTSHYSSRESHQSIWHEAWLSGKWGMLSHMLSLAWHHLHWCEPRLDHYLSTWLK